MQITLRFFDDLKQAFGRDEVRVECQEGATVSQLVAAFLNQRGLIRFKGIGFGFLVNEGFASSHTMLKNGDTLSLLPPLES